MAAPAHAGIATFSYTGAEQAFTVPVEVRSLHVVAVGGAGGGSADGPGGHGARVTADIAVTPGETLYVEVGGQGTQGPAIFGGGAEGGDGGGGGGGATDIRRSPRAAAGSDATRLLVAGGGGGGGLGQLAGAGGDADADGSGLGMGSGIGGGGTAGTTFAGGDGGDPGGQDGQLGIGGAGGSGGGGGGGGGYYGGGGGGGGRDTGGNAGGGGAGGASFVVAGAAARIATNGVDEPGSLVLSYGHATADVTPSRVVFAAQRIPTAGEQTVTVTNHGSIPLAITGVTFTGANAADFRPGPGCSAPVPPGASCQMVVRFAPRASGYRNAKLTIVSNAASGGTAILYALGLRARQPQVTALRISPSAFRAGRRALVTYRSDVAGTIRLRVLRVKTSVRGGKRRTKLIPVGASFTQAAGAGVNRLHLTGRVKEGGQTRKLPPGRYRLRAYGNGPSHAVSAAFRIVRWP